MPDFICTLSFLKLEKSHIDFKIREIKETSGAKASF
jgi:hypothetical protein